MVPRYPTPSLVPDFDVTVHIVLDDFGAAGRVYRETDEATAGREDVIDDLLSGQFNNPLRVVIPALLHSRSRPWLNVGFWPVTSSIPSSTFNSRSGHFASSA